MVYIYVDKTHFLIENEFKIAFFSHNKNNIYIIIENRRKYNQNKQNKKIIKRKERRISIRRRIRNMTQTKFNVGMTCGGCANAVKRILKKMDGVTEIDANVETKLVIVDHTDAVTSQQMLDALKKWSDASGKSVELNED